ncbi:MAG TPA: PepSY domain-containing protein [Gemmatimonadaceae bacterium]|nr:PepSY domain-containing protein [Gemmatimonadaceae bacterium]
MRPSIVIRKLHYWTSIAIALPASILLASGLLLQAKKHWSWVQPPEQRGSVTAPRITTDSVLGSVVAVPALGVRSWDDVNRIDFRPGKGVAKVWLQNGVEVQVDLGTGAVLQSAYRRSDLIESIHDGSYFGGDATKLGVFLPTGIVLLFLWVSGVWLFLVPILAKRRRAHRLRG